LVDSNTFSQTPLHYRYTPDSTGLYMLTFTATLDGRTAVDTLRRIEVLDCAAAILSPKGNWYFGRYGGLRFAPGRTFRDIGPFANRPIITNESQIDVAENSFA